MPGSDLLSILALWEHLRAQQRALSGNQFRRLCRTEFLNYLRVREWRDLFSQLRQVAGDLGIRPRTEAGHPDRIHQSVLAGLLSHIGIRDEEGRDVRTGRSLGTRSATMRAPAARRSRSPAGRCWPASRRAG